MTVFRGYLLIIKRNWGFIFIYTALFLLTMLIIQGETQKKEEKEFQRSRLKIAVVDEDGGILAEGLTNYLAPFHFPVLFLPPLLPSHEKIADLLHLPKMSEKENLLPRQLPHQSFPAVDNLHFSKTQNSKVFRESLGIIMPRTSMHASG